MKIFLNQKGSMQFTESLALKAVSLLLALILWITILGFKREEITKKVKLEPLLPPGMMITNKIPTQIQFTLSGPRVMLKDVEKKIQPIRPDLRRTRETTIGFSVSEDLLGELPAGVRVTSFSPPNILIRLEEVVERYVPVKPTFKGTPAAEHELSVIKVAPLKVAVSGPRSALDSIDFVGTEAFDIQDLKGAKDGVVSAEVDTSQGFTLSRDTLVHVHVVATKVRGMEHSSK
jgi:YbbR domain-containing protein